MADKWFNRKAPPPTIMEQRPRFWERTPKGTSAASRAGGRSSDLMVAALGVALGLTCALFPWYIFFNQEKFGIRAMKFGGGGTEVAGPITLTPQAERIGAPMAAEEIPVMKLDLFATGTLPNDRDKPDLDDAPGLDEQPFPVEMPEFRLVHVANGRAMIEDETGLWVVQRGSMLPDNTRVASIEERDGDWVIVTSAERIIAVDK